jgi:hypothetical protein
MADLNEQDFERDPSAPEGVNQWVHAPTGAVYALRPGMTVADLLASLDREQEAPPPPVAPVVSNMALRLVLARAGKLDAVNAAVVSLGTEAQVAWEYATHIRRDHPLVEAAAQAAGIGAEELDDYFRAALTASPA